jgi:Helix-turn-helix domain
MSSRLPSRFELLVERFVQQVGPMLVEHVSELIPRRYGELPPLLDANGAARFLRIDVASVRRFAREGRIPAINLGEEGRAVWRFDPEGLRQISGPVNDARG